jgi:DNA-binding protein
MIPLNIFQTKIGSGDAKMPDDNVIYIGNKSVMSYVLAVVTQFNNGFDEVVIKARGRAISRAVDTAEVTKNKFMPGIEVKDIKIGTEQLVGEGGDKANVSSLEITLKAKA